jgi:hypothetical protein
VNGARRARLGCDTRRVLFTEALWTFVVTRPAPLVVFAAVLAFAWPIGHRLAERYQCRPWVVVLFVIEVGVILALTMTPNPPPPPDVPTYPHFLTLLGNGHLIWSQLVAVPRGLEQLANIALYVPAGVLGWYMWRSALRSAGFGMALTVFIETCQYGITGRGGSITDIRNNTAGAILGAVVTAAIARARAADRSTERREAA